MSQIGLIGGTGDLGSALAIHLARKYQSVLIGSRSLEKAENSVKEITDEKNATRPELASKLKPARNETVARTADMIIATVPFENALETIKSLADSFRGNQILISAAASVVKSGSEFHPSKDPLSLAQKIREVLPSTISVASAFQTVPANILYKEMPIRSDVLVACDDAATYSKVAEVVSSIEGLKPFYAGSLEQSSSIEGLTSMLLNVAIKNKLKSPTLQINSF